MALGVAVPERAELQIEGRAWSAHDWVACNIDFEVLFFTPGTPCRAWQCPSIGAEVHHVHRSVSGRESVHRDL